MIRKSPFLWCMVLVSALCLLFACGTQDAAVSAGVAGKKPIYAVETAEKKIAFSFDAAWGADKTLDILDVFESHDLRTSFFAVEFWVRDYPDMARAIVNRGHELNNHSTTHPHLADLSREQVKKELADCSATILSVTGQAPTLFRPPFGEYTDTVIDVSFAENLIPVQWSVDSLDWKNLTADEIEARILKGLQPGAIVLFHNNGEHTVQAVKQILPKVLAEGYEVVKISDLLHGEPYSIDPTSGVQKKA